MNSEDVKTIIGVCLGAFVVGVVAFFFVGMGMNSEAPPAPENASGVNSSSQNSAPNESFGEYDDYEGVGDGIDNSAKGVATEGIGDRYDSESGKIVRGKTLEDEIVDVRYYENGKLREGYVEIRRRRKTED